MALSFPLSTLRVFSSLPRQNLTWFFSCFPSAFPFSFLLIFHSSWIRSSHSPFVSFSSLLLACVNLCRSPCASQVHDRTVIVKGRCIPPPLSIESPQYDFNVCISGNHYRHKLVLHNKQKTAMKVWVSSPSTVEGELWFEPQTSYIQGQDKLTITAAFSPREEFFTRFPQYVEEFVDPEIRINHPGSLGFSIPVRIEGSDQVLPVNTILTGNEKTKEVSSSTVKKKAGRKNDRSKKRTHLCLLCLLRLSVGREGRKKERDSMSLSCVYSV